MALLTRTTAYDLFSRQLTDTWGTGDSGHAWLGETTIHDTFYTASTLGYGRVSVAGGDTVNRVVYLDVTNSDDEEILVKIKWNTDNTTDHGPVLRYQNTSNYFFVSVIDSANDIKLGVRKNDVRTILNTGSATLAKDTYYWVRAQITGTTFRARIWAEGVVEPGSWNATTTISSTTGPTTGKPGFRTQGEGTSYSCYVDTYYYWEDTLSDLPLPVTDTFTRTVHTGASLADTGQRWHGSFADDPYLYATTKRGSIQTAQGYLALTQVSGDADVNAMIGPDTQDIEVYAKVYSSSITGNPTVRLGARHSDGTASGLFAYGTGRTYMRMQYGSTTLAVFRDGVQVTTATITAPGAGEIWHMRFLVTSTGTVNLSAKAWKDGTSEPGSYQIITTSASINNTGKAAINLTNTNATPANFRVYDFQAVAPTNNNALTTGTVSTSSVTDTSFTISATYTLDNDSDSSITMQYKKASDGTWTTAASPSVNRGTRTFSKSVTGLSPGTDYNVRCTYADADGINGTNPKTADVTTTNTGTDVQYLDLETTSTLGQIYVEAHYTHDTDNDNSAVYEYRTVTGSEIIEDAFVDVDATELSLHQSGSGDPDEVLPAIPYWLNEKTSSENVYISEDGYIYPSSLSNRHVYGQIQIEPANTTYTVDGVIEIKSLEGSAGIVTRSEGTNYYYAYYTFANDGEWHFGKCLAGVDTDFVVVADMTLGIGDTRRLRIVESGNQHTFYMGESLSTLAFVHTQTDSSITNAYVGGVMFGPRAAVLQSGIVINLYRIFIDGTAGSWVGPVSLATQTNNVNDKQRSGTITGLANDTYYDVKVTFTDADGVRNLNPVYNSILTPGTAVAFDTVPIDVTPYDTTAVIGVNYIFDTNENSTITLQYKSIRDLLWTTVNQGVISTNRTTKTFYVTLNHLIPNLAYQVRAVLDDPNGLFTGESEAMASFNTVGAIIDSNHRAKHYLHKIYGLDGEFLGTWHDAPEPEFDWHENGGLSDLSVELPRKMASINTDTTIDFGHRVDVWAIDTSLNGMGANLMSDSDMSLGSWTLTTSWTVDPIGGPDDSSALKFSSASATLRRVQSETIDLAYVVPLVVTWVGRAVKGKLRLDMAAYNSSDVLLATSDDNSETVGNQWQTLRLEWLPPTDTAYVRVRVENVGAGTMWFDKVSVIQRELLIYRGHIESFRPSFDDRGERVDIDVISLAANLADYYVKFLQFADVQPSRDQDEYANENRAPDDPSNMMKKVIDMMRAENPRCELYYTGDSIKLTGTIAEYTFREQRAEDVFDDIRNLCPSGWHWYIDPDGLVHLRGEEHTTLHVLRLNIEVMQYSVNHTIQDLKNYVTVRGRRDEDESEPDGQGTIEYIAFDQESIDRHGKRMAFVRDANIKDNDTAELVGNGRLEEWNRAEEEGEARVPDEKDIRFVSGYLGGYNIEAFKPGDEVKMLDPIGQGHSYWDQFLWDDGTWDDNENRILPNDNPIKTIKYRGHEVELALSNRPPSATGDHAKFMKWLRQQEAKTTTL